MRQERTLEFIWIRIYVIVTQKPSRFGISIYLETLFKTDHFLQATKSRGLWAIRPSIDLSIHKTCH